MLELRPTCEQCDVALPPNATNAMICTFECTFCKTCVDEILLNVCPNCGGGFCPRPNRPAKNWKDNNNLAHHPAGTRRVYRAVDPVAHAAFAAAIADITPQQR